MLYKGVYTLSVRAQLYVVEEKKSNKMQAPFSRRHRFGPQCHRLGRPRRSLKDDEIVSLKENVLSGRGEGKEESTCYHSEAIVTEGH